MYKTLVSTAGLSRQEWLQYRKKGIGGSDAAAVCGLNPYSSPLQVFLDKTSEDIEETDNEAMRIGRDLEGYVAQRFMEATGFRVRKKNFLLFQEERPFMLANVDRMVLGENAGLECKTASPYSADKWANGNVPAYYAIQCYHYMAVTGADAWYLAVLILGKEFQYIKLERKEEVIQALQQMEEVFWNQYVLPRRMPEPNGSQTTSEAIQKYFAHPIPNTSIPLPESFTEKLKQREELARHIEELKQEQSKIEQEVKLYLGDREAAQNENYFVTWKGYSSKRLDTARMQKEAPELYQRYLQTTISRRFSVKSA